jgi:Mitochondrial ribosomal protein (VAR1)
MYDNEIKPSIFKRKINDNNKVIPLNRTNNTLGPIRYYPPANQEWFNSIYSYNNVYTKNITVSDKMLSKIIKSYFNLYFSKKLFHSKRTLTRFRRLAINRMFISKAELKHTNSKVIITIYVYNEERRALLNRLRRIEAILFPSFNLVSKKMYKDKILSLYEKLNIIRKVKGNFLFKNWLEVCKEHIIGEIDLEKKGLVNVSKSNLKKNKILEINTLEENLKSLLVIMATCENDYISFQKYESIYSRLLYKTLLEKEISIITYFKLLLTLNKSKFEDKFLLGLKPIIKKIYNKEVEFNIVNLKSIYLNSDIFTQLLSLKLRNRNNRLLIVLKHFLHMVKLPKINVLRERFLNINIKDLWVNKVKNLTTKSFNLNMKEDTLNWLLISLFSDSNFDFSGKLKGKELVKKNLINFVLNTLKYKNLSGVRLEAKGRLTRRFTASISVFKIKWKGSLKNVDSSYRGLSSVILRGHVKSNVQNSIINSKTRNGAFGIKGWISGK